MNYLMMSIHPMNGRMKIQMSNPTTEWIFENEVLPQAPIDSIGFVYLITNNETGKKYIGKKNFFTPKTSVKTVTLKNGNKKKKKTKTFVDSDWKEYYGSNNELQKDVEALGPEKFTRKILKICKSKSEMTYWETYFQFVTHSLVSSDYYNSWIMCRVRADHIVGIDISVDIDLDSL